METGHPNLKKEEALREFEEAIKGKNYIRAEMLAKNPGRPAEEVRELQHKAVKQLIMQHRNPEGAVALVEEYNFTREDIERLLQSILQKSPTAAIKQFDMKTMRFLSLEEWVKEHFRR